MNAIMGMTDLTLDTKLDSEQRDYLQTARDASESLLALIDDILDFSKIEAGKLELELLDFSLRDSVENAVKTLAIRAQEKDLELAVGFAVDVPDSVVGDPERLRQIIVNLVGNAIKFTEVGEIEVSTKLDVLESAEVALRFTVRDTGVGIEEEKLASIFESFSQADVSTTRQYGGTGLGLAISSQLADRMGGRMWVESTFGEGTSFHFIARFGMQENPVETSQDRGSAELVGVDALVVDDNATNRKEPRQPARELGIAGYGGRRRRRGDHQAYRGGRARYPRSGSCFWTVACRGLTGSSSRSASWLTIASRDAELMMLTSAGAPGDAARCRELGISSYLTKPVPQTDLWDALCSIVGTEDVAGPQLVTQQSLRAARGSLHVLLAEDNPVNVKLASRLLEKRGHNVVVAGNGREALDLLQAEGPFDVVLMDVQMPVMDGFEATAEIRSREAAEGGHVPIIGVTAHAMAGDMQRCLDVGMDDYLSKPFIAKDLFALIEKHGED